MADILIITYVHSCSEGCTHQGQEVNYHPRCDGGTAFEERLTCVDTGAELELLVRTSVAGL